MLRIVISPLVAVHHVVSPLLYRVREVERERRPSFIDDALHIHIGCLLHFRLHIGFQVCVCVEERGGRGRRGVM